MDKGHAASACNCICTLSVCPRCQRGGAPVLFEIRDCDSLLQAHSLCCKSKHADTNLCSHSLHRPGSALCCPTLLDNLVAAEPFRLRSNLAAPNRDSAHSGLTATSPPPLRLRDTWILRPHRCSALNPCTLCRLHLAASASTAYPIPRIRRDRGDLGAIFSLNRACSSVSI